MSITIISILAISAVVWGANKFMPFRVCPICAGVLLTWVGLVGAHLLGYTINLIIPALLMGGTVVGVAYQLEKKMQNASPGRILLWKALFIPAGFVVAYAVLEQMLVAFLAAAVFLALVSFALVYSRSAAGPSEGSTSEIEKKMENCC